MPGEVRVRWGRAEEEWARLCLRAAGLRSQFKSFVQIARELELPDPKEAQRAVRQGIALMPADDVREIRRLEDLRLARIGEKLLAVVEDPGPLVSQGKIMYRDDGPDAPEVPYADEMTRVRALEGLMKLSAEFRKLHGADAPRKTMAITQDMITERIMELRRELGDAADGVLGALPGGDDSEPGSGGDGRGV